MIKKEDYSKQITVNLESARIKFKDIQEEESQEISNTHRYSQSIDITFNGNENNLIPPISQRELNDQTQPQTERTNINFDENFEVNNTQYQQQDKQQLNLNMGKNSTRICNSDSQTQSQNNNNNSMGHQNNIQNDNNNNNSFYEKKNGVVEKLKKVKFVITTTFKIIFHYVDSTTDLFMIYEYAVLAFEDYSQIQKSIYFTVCLMNLLISFLADRFFSYKYLISSILTEKKLEKRLEVDQSHQPPQPINSNNSDKCQTLEENIKVTQKDQIICILITMTLQDYIYILYLQHDNQLNLQRKLVQKSLIELICENFLFLFGSTLLFLLKVVKNEEIQFMDYLAMATSFSSSSYIIYSMFLHRVEEQGYFKNRNEVKYSEMSIETKRYVSNPFILAYFKEISEDKFIYPEITNSKKDVDTKKEKKLTFLQKIYILLIIFIEIFAMVVPFCLQNVVENMVAQFIRFAQGWMAYLPQCFIYLKTFTKENQKKFIQQQNEKNKIMTVKQKKANVKSEALKIATATPFLYIVGCIQMRFPLGMQEFPFFPRLKENWCLNFNPTIYVVWFRIVVQWYDIWSVYTIMTQKLINNQMEAVFEENDIQERIFSSDTILWTYWYFSLLFVSLSFIINLSDTVYKLYQKYFKKSKKN